MCSRPGIVNSVSMEGNKTDVIFPVIADTKWNCIALLCDDTGIPKTPEKRIEVFKRILEEADKYGISHDRLFIDPLVVTLSTDEEAFTTFADTVRQIKKSIRTSILQAVCPISHSVFRRETHHQSGVYDSRGTGRHGQRDYGSV